MPRGKGPLARTARAGEHRRNPSPRHMTTTPATPARRASSAARVTTSWINGPILGSTVCLGQSSTTSFPFIQFVPTGTPGNPIVYAQPNAPTGYDG